MSSIEGSPGYIATKVLREDGIIHEMAIELVEQFKQTTGACDQRPTRTGIWARIVGK